MAELTHFDRHGEAHMVNIGDKDITHRIAIATGKISMQAATLDRIRRRGHKKGDVLGVARIAGIMAAKKTAEIIPLCHSLQLSSVRINFMPVDNPPRIECEACIELNGRTGAEIEALFAVQTALLTIYDMCKSVDRGMCISDVRLVKKSGGKSGDWTRKG